MYCSKQQPKRQNEDLPTTRTSDSTQPPMPAVVYANVERSQQPALDNNHVYVNFPPTNDYEANGAVQYSELQHKDNK